MSVNDSGFPVLYDDQPADTTGDCPVYQPGAIFVWKHGTGRANRSVVQYVRLDNNGCSYGEALAFNTATVVSHSVKVASLGQDADFVGIAAATIASQEYGFMVIAGYCEYAYSASDAASGETMCLSATTTGQLTTGKAHNYYSASATDASGLLGIAFSNGAVAAGGLASITLLGTWGV